MVVRRASCLRRGRLSICCSLPSTLRLGLLQRQVERRIGKEQFLDGDVEGLGETEGHLGGDAKLGDLVIGNKPMALPGACGRAAQRSTG